MDPHDSCQNSETMKVGITLPVIINQPPSKIDLPIYCLRCKLMKTTKNNPNISTIECGTCMNDYCYDCYDAHKRGKCYICRAPGCYVHDIRKIVCYECL
uniref:Uncharacterized protein n=1 Tax=viral metagenome TaxID=1070528 RepID=A0A6C0CB65_9ZZZZ